MLIILVNVADPFHLVLPDPDLLHETDPGSNLSAKIMDNSHTKK